MFTGSHGYLTWHAARRLRHPGLVALGATAPDLPAYAMAVGGLLRGLRGQALIDDIYDPPGRAIAHRALHSALVAPPLLALAPSSRLRALGIGWAAHLAVDVVSHRADAWQHLWPASTRVFRSPVSYHERDHHARLWTACETAVVATLAARSGSRAGRAVGALATVGAAAPLLKDGLRALRRRRTAATA